MLATRLGPAPMRHPGPVYEAHVRIGPHAAPRKDTTNDCPVQRPSAGRVIPGPAAGSRFHPLGLRMPPARFGRGAMALAKDGSHV